MPLSEKEHIIARQRLQSVHHDIINRIIEDPIECEQRRIRANSLWNLFMHEAPSFIRPAVLVWIPNITHRILADKERVVHMLPHRSFALESNPYQEKGYLVLPDVRLPDDIIDGLKLDPVLNSVVSITIEVIGKKHGPHTVQPFFSYQSLYRPDEQVV